MALSIAIQMDPIESIDIDADSSFALALEAQARGHRLYHYHPSQLALRDGKLFTTLRSLEVWRRKGDHHTLGVPARVDLSGVDVVLMRQDPPFDLAYITATHQLEHIQATTLIVNDPGAVRNAPEKLLVTHFPDLAPPTLITGDKREIVAFRAEYKDIILKPLFGNGGAGIFHVKPDDENFNAMLETYAQRSREPIVVQAYLPAVRKGDKRIILVEGEAVGAINRVPQAGEARSNMQCGRQGREECVDAARAGDLRRHRPHLARTRAGLRRHRRDRRLSDRDQRHLATGVQEIDRFNGSNLAGLIWDAIEKRRAAQVEAKGRAR